MGLKKTARKVKNAAKWELQRRSAKRLTSGHSPLFNGCGIRYCDSNYTTLWTRQNYGDRGEMIQL